MELFDVNVIQPHTKHNFSRLLCPEPLVSRPAVRLTCADHLPGSRPYDCFLSHRYCSDVRRPPVVRNTSGVSHPILSLNLYNASASVFLHEPLHHPPEISLLCGLRADFYRKLSEGGKNPPLLSNHKRSVDK